MTRKDRTKILILEGDGLRSRLAEEIEAAHPVFEVEKPSSGLVLVKMREGARNHLFYMGEVLVTQAKVRVAGATGLGILRGYDERAAFELAVIDAAIEAKLPETTGWDGRLAEAQGRLDARLAVERARLDRTTVSFETMDTEARA